MSDKPPILDYDTSQKDDSAGIPLIIRLLIYAAIIAAVIYALTPHINRSRATAFGSSPDWLAR